MGQAIWLEGRSRSGKTQRLTALFQEWQQRQTSSQTREKQTNGALVLVANSETRRRLLGQLQIAVAGQTPIVCKTPLGLIREAVLLFWPLVVTQGLSPAFTPTQLRSETEQLLALGQWQQQFPQIAQGLSLPNQGRLVRNLLDMLQLAGAAGLDDEALSDRLLAGQITLPPGTLTVEQSLAFLRHWRRWCLQRGFLTYGLMFRLYGQCLLPHSDYQQYLHQTYQALFADDVDDYPAIAVELLEQLRPQLALSVLTFNPDGQVRLGLNADPEALSRLAQWGTVETLPPPAGIDPNLSKTVLALLHDARSPQTLPLAVQSLQTFSRAQLLRQTAEYIIDAVQSKTIAAKDIAIIAPGLDDIARYSFLDILGSAGIEAIALHEQRPLSSSPLIRSLLTLMALIYGLGDWARREQVAEMLVMLSQQRRNGHANPPIDPVRAGLIVDTCYAIDPHNPQLLPLETYPRWDRFGYQASGAYHQLRQWVDQQKKHCHDDAIPPIEMLMLAIREQLPPQSTLTYGELESLREVLETLQHFWQVQQALQGGQLRDFKPILAQFFQLLSQGTVSARPRPETPLWLPPPPTVTLATIYQYRSLRSQHRWHFWLDAGDRLWEMGGASQLFAAPLFLRHRSAQPWTEAEQQQWDQARFERIIRDLLARVTDRLILCHSDLSVRGTEQIGQLLNVIQRAQPAIINN
ncbi:MAG: hypothetical protein VKJ27_03920 [Synechocystis sp.]|nr:hypothetical protein [Synechocystis sp.]